MIRLRLISLCGAALLIAACSPPAESRPAVSPTREAVETPEPGPPKTDIFLFELAEQNGELSVGGAGDRGPGPAAANITDRAGYDNQPHFTADGLAVLYTSIRDDGQADIYRYDIAVATTRRLTRTPESEYSPTPTPDGLGISAVRVEMDSTQRLWRFDADGRNPRLVLERVRPVGYHAWAGENTLVLFVLGSPATLQIADLRTGTVQSVAEDIGRSLHPIPGRHAVSYVQNSVDGERWIRELDVTSRRTAVIAPAVAEREDHAWTPSGALLMGSGSVLYRWNGDEREWLEVVDLEAAGVRDISRIAVSPGGDRIAVVSTRR